MFNKINNTLRLIYHVGLSYLAFVFSKNEKGFDAYLMDKQNKAYGKFTYIWLHQNYKRKQDLYSLLKLWHLGNKQITFTRDSNREKFHASAFEAAVSVRDESTASEALKYLDKSSNYFELSNILMYVFFNSDKSIENINMADKPRPYYLHYLFPMCEGIIAESRNDLTNAQIKYNLAIKKVEYNFADRVFLDSRISDITNQINSKIRTAGILVTD